MGSKIRVLLIIILLLPIAGGCWDRREPEELLLVNSILLDWVKVDHEGQYRMAYMASKPSLGVSQTGTAGGDSGQQTPTRWIASSFGNTLQEALSKLTTRAPRYTYLSHTRMVILGEGLVNRGLKETMDFLIRKQNIRLRNYVLVAKGVEDVMSAQPEYEATLTEELFSILRLGSGEDDYFHYNDLNRFTQDLLTFGQDPWAPVIKTFTPTETKENIAHPAVMIEGTALFNRDRLAGFLNTGETQGFLILKGLAHKGSISIDNDGKQASFSYHKTKVKREAVFKNNSIAIEYLITISGLLEEIDFPSNLSEGEIAQLEKMFALRMGHMLARTIEKCQELGSDALGTGRFIHATYPDIWHEYSGNWSNIYPEIEIGAKVDVKITGTDFGYRPIVPVNDE